MEGGEGKLKKVFLFFVLCCFITGCQSSFKLDKKIIPNYVENTMKELTGYKIDEVYYYHGKHMRVHKKYFGEGMAIKVIISYKDIVKDPKRHEIVYVLDDEGIDLGNAGYIYGEDPEIIEGIDKVEVYDKNKPITYCQALNNKEISKINRRINPVKLNRYP